MSPTSPQSDIHPWIATADLADKLAANAIDRFHSHQDEKEPEDEVARLIVEEVPCRRGFYTKHRRA